MGFDGGWWLQSFKLNVLGVLDSTLHIWKKKSFIIKERETDHGGRESEENVAIAGQSTILRPFKIAWPAFLRLHQVRPDLRQNFFLKKSEDIAAIARKLVISRSSPSRFVAFSPNLSKISLDLTRFEEFSRKNVSIFHAVTKSGQNLARFDKIRRVQQNLMLCFDIFQVGVWVARRPQGYAFVEFDDRRDAIDAICELDG
ncbi:hypothetical protein COLO4_22760 [Corchorus olitorius]|uniref:RRM domain-containing protein n=1 Tax=Corchorus olitorius TaxID=93759 RepID=A0A1R3IK29_9ROSI|nr:hypothetical protein COLO4_22760 [Corchorus olitorius]